MKTPAQNRFDTLASAYHYIAVLEEVLDESRTDVHDELELAENAGAARTIDALQLVAYKLERLREHLGNSRCVLNDLRMLRRVLTAGVPDARRTVSYNQGDAFARDPQ